MGNDTIKLVTIDTEDEYKKLAEKLGGKIITLDPSSPYKYNPFGVLKKITSEEQRQKALEILKIAGETHLQNESDDDFIK